MRSVRFVVKCCSLLVALVVVLGLCVVVVTSHQRKGADMAAWANAIGAGALGRLIGNASDIWGSGAKLRHQKQKEALQQERDSFMGRIEAAKAAGLHPLMGLGGGGFGGGGSWDSGAAPIPVDFSERKVDPNIDRYNAARADLAEIQVMEARRALANQPGNPPPSAQTDEAVIQPAKITSASKSDPTLQAGPAAASEQRFMVRGPFGDIQAGNLPSTDVGEKVENMGEIWSTILMLPMALRFIWDTWVPPGLKQDFSTAGRMIRRGVGDPGRGGGFEGRSNSPW